MTIKTEVALKDFEFWGRAKDKANYLTDDEFDIIEAQIDAIFPDEVSEVDVNDFFWFEDDFIAELLGYNSFEEIIMERDI